MAQIGKTFELLVRNCFTAVYRTCTTIRFTDTNMDTLHGADLLVNGYPVDITLNANKKYIGKKFAYKGKCLIYFRYSNGNIVFERPTVVIELNIERFGSLNETARQCCNLLIDLSRDLDKILELLHKKSVAPDLTSIRARAEHRHSDVVVGITSDGQKIYGR